MAHPRAEEIAAHMAATRADTLQLFDLARRESDLHASPGFGFRPIIWHLAHIGVFEAYWLLQKLAGEPAPDARYERIFDPITTPREESKDLPTRREMEAYLTRVRARVLRLLDRANFAAAEPLLRDGYIFNLVLEHERQHQETLAYLLHLHDPAQKLRPQAAQFIEPGGPPAPPNMIEVPAGECVLGAPWPMVFVYDNELPAHTVNVPAFKIDRLLTTNEEFAHFIAEGGYERREWWDAAGWAWREKENWTCPLYWTRNGADDNGDWRARTMFDESALALDHPVIGVSWYEAEAYASFCGNRLPTEAEWEKAAAWETGANAKRLFAWGDDAPTKSRGNFDFRYWGTTPVGSFPAGASATGCLDMNGNVWEWTAAPFAGYPGFKAYPYPEYSETWFDTDHRVLKGGSWATRPTLLRTSFRNFFRRHFRIAFAGIRLAEDD